MKIRRLFPLLFASALFIPFVGCVVDVDYGKDNDYAEGIVEINDVDCTAGSYGGYSGWDNDRQLFVMPLTYRFTYGTEVTDGYFTFTFTGAIPKVGDNLAVGRDLILSTDGVNRLAYRSGSAKVRSVDYKNNRITIEYDDLEMGAAAPNPNAPFNNAGSYDIDGWQTVSFDFSTGPGTL